MNLFHVKRGNQGDPMLLLHGFCENHAIWEDIMPYLSSTCLVYAADMPGFGASEALPEENFTIADVAKKMWEFVDKLGITENLTLVGHSLGGYVALEMVAQRPAAARKVILLNSTPLPDTEKKKENRLKMHNAVASLGAEPFLENFVPSLFYQKNEHLLRRVRDIAMSTKKETVMSYALAMRARTSYIPVIEQASEKFLLLAGEKDEILPLASLREVAQRHGINIVTIPDTGHASMLEAPQTCATAITEFLNDNMKAYGIFGKNRA